MGEQLPLPEGLARRPKDRTTGLPVPYTLSSPDPLDVSTDVADFTAVVVERVAECGKNRLCALCHEPLTYWVVFLGGPLSAASRTYVDGPMHEECAVAATRLCPHIAVQRHKRAPEHRLDDDVHTPEGFVDSKPAVWVMGVTRTYEMFSDRQHGLYFRAAPWKRVRTFEYDAKGNLYESTPG